LVNFLWIAKLYINLISLYIDSTHASWFTLNK
jgi:hypothetical protein